MNFFTHVVALPVAETLLVADKLSDARVHANGALLFMRVFHGLHMRDYVFGQCVQHFATSVSAQSSQLGPTTYPSIAVRSSEVADESPAETELQC
jgi:hypothetical protein